MIILKLACSELFCRDSVASDTWLMIFQSSCKHRIAARFTFKQNPDSQMIWLRSEFVLASSGIHWHPLNHGLPDLSQIKTRSKQMPSFLGMMPDLAEVYARSVITKD